MNKPREPASESKGKKQVARRPHENMTHEEAEGAVPENLAVAGEEDGGVGIQHWHSDDDGDNDDDDEAAPPPNS